MSLTAIAIQGFKGIKYCCLDRLGKINVICGKNNSGKTTVLEGMQSEKNELGISIPPDGNMPGDLLHKINNTAGRWEATHKDDLVNIIIQVLSTKSSWYRNDSQEFKSELERSLENIPHLSDIAADKKKIDQIAFGLLHEISMPSVILIPPQRRLEEIAKVNSKAEVVPSGEGILKKLFEAKNSNDLSREKQSFEKILDAFLQISGGYRFDVILENSDEIKVVIKFKNGNWIKSQDCGSGLHDLLVILYFAQFPGYNVLLVEEPESHLHPEMQRKLLIHLKDESSKQYIFTTHSNVFVNSAYVDRVFFTQYDGKISISDATSRAAILQSIGYDVTDNLTSDLVILVEGPKDKPALEEFLIKLGLLGKYNIKIWPLGGDIMDQLDLSVFSENYNIIALIDKDPKSSSVRKNFSKLCKDQSIQVHKLSRYALENYYTLRALREVFDSQIDSSITRLDSNKKLESQIGFNVKKNSQKIAHAMTLKELEGTDLFDFFVEVENICKAQLKG